MACQRGFLAVSPQSWRLAHSLTATSLATAAAAINLPGELAYPESLAASSDGTLFIGSAKMGGVQRVTPGSSTPTQWIAPTTFGTRSIFGVLVDERSGTLWTCSNDLASDGIASPGSGTGSALKGFDLKTGVGKVSAPFPGDHPLCNDIAVAKDGRVYVSDEYSARVLRLSADSRSLEIFVSDPQLADIDGIAFGADGNLYANTYEGSGLFRIDVRHETAGKVVKLSTSRPITHPDGMRRVTGNMFLMVEAAGTLDRVSVRGDKALIETIRSDMREPSAVTSVGRTAWVAEGQIGVLYDVKHPKPPKAAFRRRTRAGCPWAASLDCPLGGGSIPRCHTENVASTGRLSKPLLLTSPSGLRAEINANGSLRRLDCGAICLALFVGNELEGGPANLYLRRHSDKIEWIPLLGPSSQTRFHSDPTTGKLVGSGSWLGIDYVLTLTLAKTQPVWFWHVRLENTGATSQQVDLTYAQDVALASYGGIRLNEFYVSQYLDHTALEHAQRGVMVATRQNLAADGRIPWSLIGSLREGTSYATDAKQFHDLATRAGEPPSRTARASCPGRRLQHEHAMVVIRDASIRLEPKSRVTAGFFGLYVPDHPEATATTDAARADDALGLPEATPDNLELQPAEGPDNSTLFSAAPLLETLDLDADSLRGFFGSQWRHDEVGRARPAPVLLPRRRQSCRVALEGAASPAPPRTHPPDRPAYDTG